MNGNDTTERTPLLSGERESASNHVQDGEAVGDQRPNLANIEHTLRLTGDGHSEPFDPAATLVAVQSLAVSATEKTALLLLLSLRHLERLGERKVGVSAAVKQAQSKDREAAERLRDETYDEMCDQGDVFAEQALWTSFPRDADGKEEQSVMDALYKRNHLTELSTHHRTTQSLLSTWEKGCMPRNSAVRENFFQRFQSLATPRILHAIELTFHIIYLGILITYVLHPHKLTITASDDPPITVPSPIPSPSPLPTNQHPLRDWRISTILVYCTSRIFQNQSFNRGPFLVVFTCFFTHVLQGTLPGANDTAYLFLLLMLATHLFELHATRPPTPLLLLLQTKALPLAKVMETVGAEAWTPALAFYLPMLYVLFVLLSTSAADTFNVLKWELPFTISLPWRIVSPMTEPAPGLARALFAGSIVVVLISIILFAAAMTMLLPSFPWQNKPPNPWDAYGLSFGFQTRQTIYIATKNYIRPHYFPAPFNLLELIFVEVPALVLRLLKLSETAEKLRASVGSFLWNIFVLPTVCVFSLLWLFDSVKLLRERMFSTSVSDS